MKMLAAFGDSFTDYATYQNVSSLSWLNLLQSGPLAYEVFYNYASGGSVTGQKNHYVYKADGAVIETQGLLGQIEEYNNGIGQADAHVIWSGTNDLVVASQLDPFYDENGVYFETTELVKGFRHEFMIAQSRNRYDYAAYIVTQYLIPNINKAIDELIKKGHQDIIVVGYFDLSCMPVAVRADDQRRDVAKYASSTANTMLKTLCHQKGVHFVDVFGISPVTFDDLIHPDTKTNKAVLMEMLKTVFN